MRANADLRNVGERHNHPASPQILKRLMAGKRVSYPEEIEQWLAVALAMVAGFLDAYGMINYRTYLSFMSGNTTQAGYEIGEGKFGPAMYSVLLAIVFFVCGSFVGALLERSSVRRTRRLVFGVIATSLALIIGFEQIGFSSNWVTIAMISFAMGAMNTALSRVSEKSESLTFVTGTLSRIGMQLALAVRRAPLSDSRGPWDSHARRALGLAAIWIGFLSGALLSGAATPRFGVCALLFPMLAMSALAAFDRSSSAQPQTN
jgi:uncharacterized membrane protein YoaK (UPF0700 family)